MLLVQYTKGNTWIYASQQAFVPIQAGKVRYTGETGQQRWTTCSVLWGYCCTCPRPYRKACHGLPQCLVCRKLLELLAVRRHKLDLEYLSTYRQVACTTLGPTLLPNL